MKMQSSFSGAMDAIPAPDATALVEIGTGSSSESRFSFIRGISW